MDDAVTWKALIILVGDYEHTLTTLSFHLTSQVDFRFFDLIALDHITLHNSVLIDADVETPPERRRVS